MGSASHEAEPDRERYERIAAAAAELAQLLIALEALTSLDASDLADLFVGSLTTLVDDAITLAPSAPRPLRVSPAFTTMTRGAATPPPQVSYEVARIDAQPVARIDARIVETRSSLADAISNAKQACKELAVTADHADPSHLHAITAALGQISTDLRRLGQLAHDRLAVSALGGGPGVSHVDTLRPTSLTTPAASAAFTTRPIAMPVPPSPTPPPPPLASPALDDPLRRSPRTMGPAGMA
jgi:hypothetical protein